VAYVATLLPVIYVITPVQNHLFNNQYSQFSFLFLPHGIRILGAWLYSWRSVPAIAPGAFIGHFMLFGSDGFAKEHIFAYVIGITVCPLVFSALERLKYTRCKVSHTHFSWRYVMMAGLIASIFNSVLTNLIYHAPLEDYLGYIIGDLFGLFFLLLLLIFGLRLLKKRVDF